MANDSMIQVQISMSSSTLTRKGFGTPMIVGYHTIGASRVTSYSSAEEAVLGGHAAEGPIVKGLSAVFAQNPRPATCKVGRRALAPTRVLKLSPTVTTEGFVYAFSVQKLEGATPAITAISYAVPAAATTTTIAAALATALGAVTGITSSAAAGVVTMTGAVGKHFAILRPTFEVQNALGIEDATVDPGITTDLTAIYAEDEEWYGLALAEEGDLESLAAGNWAAGKGIVYAPSSCSTKLETTTTGNLAASIKTASLRNTLMPVYARSNSAHFGGARLLGMCLPFTPGEIQLAYKKLVGITADRLPTSAITNLKANACTCYVAVAGVPCTYGEWAVKTGSGEWADVVMGADWLQVQIKEDQLDLLLSAKKVPYNDAGLAMVEGQLRSALGRGTKYVINNDFTVVMPALASVSSADKTARFLQNVSFSGTLQGAITAVKITGTLAP